MGLDQLKPFISKEIQAKVKGNFADSVTQAINDNNENIKGKIDQFVGDILSPKHSFIRKKCDSIGLPLCKGLLSISQHFEGISNLGFRIASTLQGLYSIVTIVENVKTGLKERLESESRDCLLLSLLITQNCGVNRKIANDFCLANQDLQNSWYQKKHLKIIK